MSDLAILRIPEEREIEALCSALSCWRLRLGRRVTLEGRSYLAIAQRHDRAVRVVETRLGVPKPGTVERMAWRMRRWDQLGVDPLAPSDEHFEALLQRKRP
jgi:hypothetical protein